MADGEAKNIRGGNEWSGIVGGDDRWLMIVWFVRHCQCLYFDVSRATRLDFLQRAIAVKSQVRLEVIFLAVCREIGGR